MDRRDATPSNILTAEDLLKKLREGVQTSFTIENRGIKAVVRIISNVEMAQIRREAMTYAATFGGDETEKNLFIQRGTLALACTDAYTKIPSIPPKFWEIISLDELKYFYEEYVLIMDNVNPSLESLSSDQFRALVDALKKNIVSPKELSMRQLRAICSAFAELIRQAEHRASQMDNSSGGQP